MSQILVSKYKTGVDFPPLRTGLTHVAGENTLTFPINLGILNSRLVIRLVHTCVLLTVAV